MLVNIAKSLLKSIVWITTFYDKLTTLTSEKAIHYRLTYADNDEELFKSEFYVYKKTEKYEKAPDLSKYPKKYHKKTLTKFLYVQLRSQLIGVVLKSLMTYMRCKRFTKLNQM